MLSFLGRFVASASPAYALRGNRILWGSASLGAVLLFGQTSLLAETLQDAWASALHTDHGLAAARETTASARELLAESKSHHLPRVTTDTAYSVLSSSLTSTVSLGSLGTLPINIADNHLLVSRTAVQVPLYTGGRIHYAVQAASAGVSVAGLGEQRAAMDVKMEVATAYLNVLRSRRMLAVTDSSVKSLDSYRKDVANLYEQGVVARNDLLSAQVALADARQERLKAEDAVQLAEAAYNRAVGRPMDSAVEIDEIEPDPEMHTLVESITAAFEHRPEIQEFDQQQRAVHSLSRAAAASMLPQIGVSGGYDYIQNRFIDQQGFWTASAGVQWNIFDFGEARHRMKAFDAQARAVSNREQEIRTKIELQVRKAWLDVHQTHERVQVAKETIDAANENLKVARDRYAENVGSGTEVLGAETLRVRSLSNEANAIYDEVQASYALRRATGEI